MKMTVECPECDAVRIATSTCTRCQKRARTGVNGECLRCLFIGIQTGEHQEERYLVASPPTDGCSFDLETSCCARAKSNFFRVKDKEAFREFCGEWGILYRQGPTWRCKEHQLCGFECPHGMPSGDKSCPFPLSLSRYLASGTVAVVHQIQWNQGHYDAWTLAVNSEGKQIFVDIDDIYERLQELGQVDHRGQELDVYSGETW
jgi:hypothetical protein